MKEKQVSTEVIAEMLSVTPRRVQQLAKDGVIPAAGTRPYTFNQLEVAKEYIRYLSSKITGKEEKTSTQQRSRKKSSKQKRIGKQQKQKPLRYSSLNWKGQCTERRM